MTRSVLRGSIQRKILLIAACALASAWVQVPVAMAQHAGGRIGGGHVGSGVRTGAPHVFVPSASHATISGPRVIAGPRLAGVGTRFHFRQGPINAFRRRFFFGAPFFRFGVGWGFNSLWWLNCGPFYGWEFYCNALPFIGYGFENYVTLEPYEIPVYLYGPREHELVWLYLKDGTVYSVIDYWFVSGQVHFIAVEESGAKSVEHVIGMDELDLPTTIDVNTRRGFRVVMRDEPLEQYMRDHPNPMPPLLEPLQKN